MTLASVPTGARSPDCPSPAVVHIVDGDSLVLERIRFVLKHSGLLEQTYPSAEAFLAAGHPAGEGCVMIDDRLPGIGGLDLLRRLSGRADPLPMIMITSAGDVRIAVAAMKAGASDCIEKPVSAARLLTAVAHALALSRDAGAAIARWRTRADRIARLTRREREVLDLVLDGHPSKNIAADLGISQRTVENHRAAIMTKTGAKSLPALARLAVSAAEPERPPHRLALSAG
ncbi:MAG: response regulator transcription factor [Caulobacterales bacterium]